MRKMKMKLFDVNFEDGTCASVVAYDFYGAEFVAKIFNKKASISSITFSINVFVYR